VAGYDEVRHLQHHFIPCQPPDTDFVPVSRTVGRPHRRRTDSQVYTIEMPWILPGVRPTGRRGNCRRRSCRVQDGKIAGEHIYWDQASVLAQVGLIDAGKLPATKSEASRKVIDASQEPSNALIKR
jgi:carboxymethylenebutenolidase